VPQFGQFPDPAIRLGPDVAYPVPEGGEQVRARAVAVRARAIDRQPHALEQVTVVSPLRQVDRAVAVERRPRVTVVATREGGAVKALQRLKAISASLIYP